MGQLPLLRLSLLGPALLVGCNSCEEEPLLGANYALCAEPAALDYGNVAVRTDGTRTLLVTNCGKLPISGITSSIVASATGLAEDPETFDALPTVVESPLRPGDFFYLPVRFRPRTQRNHAADLQLNVDGARGNPVTTVALTGIGVPLDGCNLEMSPDPVVFPDTAISQQAELTVTLTNQGTVDCDLTGVRILEGHDEFSIIQPPPEDIALGESVTLTLAFRPSAEGARSGRLVAVIGGHTELSLPLTGNGLSIDACRLRTDPVTITLPHARLGLASTEIGATLESYGELPCTIRSVSVSSTSTDFSVLAAPAAGTVLQTGGSTALTVGFAPLQAGQRSGTLVVETEEGTVLEAPLSGFADPTPACAIAFSPPLLSFEPLALGLESEASVSITNASDITCSITGARLAQNSSSDFELTVQPAVGVLAAGASTTATIRFSPTVAAPRLGQVIVEIDGTSEAPVDLIGFGDIAEIVLTPALQHFGLITQGCVSRTFEVQMTNVGDVAARIDSVGFSAVTDPNFQLLTPVAAGTMLLPGVSSTMSLRMAGAPGAGNNAGFLQVQSTGTVDPLIQAALFGATDSVANAQRTDVFVQRERPAIDILFVVDNSGSMQAEQTNLAQNFSAFIAFTTTLDVDYHIGITTTDDDDEGALVAPFIANTGPGASPDPASEFVAAVNVGTTGSGSERGLSAAANAITEPVRSNQNAGFLREDALLSIVMVSDEEDQSPGAVSDYIDEYLAAKDYVPNSVIVSAVAGDVPAGCNANGNSATGGNRYFDATSALGGLFASICTPDWANTMQELGVVSFAALTRFQLSRIPETSTVIVVVDGAVIPNDPLNGWTYDATTNAIRFNGTSVPDAGESVEVSYTAECLLP